jgi:cytochrome P450
MHLARTEMRIAVEELTSTLADIRLDPDFPPPVITGTLQRGPSDVHVVFRPVDTSRE